MSFLPDGNSPIEGLAWSNLWSIPNGANSRVVPIPNLRPSNVIFKGDASFSYGHFGVHLGQTDRLVFLGPKANTIMAHFIDCRRESSTFKVRFTASFPPSSTRLLTIPPGVAHTFDTEAISTLNLYSMMLPEPEKWLSPDNQWTVKGDIVNVKMDVSDDDIPPLTPNSQRASETFYKLIALEQEKSLSDLIHEYPSTEDIKFADGTTHRLKFWKRLQQQQIRPDWTPIPGIHSAGWKSNRVVWTGEVSGYVPILDRRPKHLIDHGESSYTHDAYGIHLGGDDHLLFVGPSWCRAVCELVDLREDSPTLHQSVRFEFCADPLQTLVVPRGVAHRFEHLEGIYTINQPLTFLPEDDSYEPGYDVIDWPLARRPFPVLKINKVPAVSEFYEDLALRQLEMISSPPTHATPSILLAEDHAGTPIRVAMRERVRG
jgi:dTDP-4-dehydrorhamnose 3,5-epimerase-like enzyme